MEFILALRRLGNLTKVNEGAFFEEDSVGKFRIYAMPTPQGQYIIGGDAAEGLPGGDKSAAVVLNLQFNQTVAVYNHNIDPDQFAYDISLLSKFYNEALVAVENKGYGYTVNQGLFREGVRLHKKIKTKEGVPEHTYELGWNTNAVSRPEMLALLKEEIWDNLTQLLDTDLIKQCWTFMKNPKKGGKPEAQEGCNDDLVIARAIAGRVRQFHPYSPDTTEQVPKTRGEEFWEVVKRDVEVETIRMKEREEEGEEFRSL